MNTPNHILLTIDVEDWFQVENFKPWIPFSTWDLFKLRVERNVHRILDLLDSVELEPPRLSASQPPNRRKPKATFFVLGWLADRLPNHVREILSRGHEVASHGCNHQLLDQLSDKELKQDLTDSKKLLEDITGSEVAGYRAPSFSISRDNLKIIQDAGYLYDSSYNSFSLHDRYGSVSLNGTIRNGIVHKLSDDFYELPISNLLINRWIIPWGGGGYFRLIPDRLFQLGVKTILKRDKAYIFFMHPWEIDPEQPKVSQATFNFKFRHYTNLTKTQAKLRSLLESFNHCQYVTCSEYLSFTTGSEFQDRAPNFPAQWS